MPKANPSSLNDITGQKPNTAKKKGKDGATADAHLEAAKLGAKILKGAWNVIKDSKAQATTTAESAKILCVSDEHWGHYSGGKEARSKPVTWKLDNFAGVNCFTIEFSVSARCGAKHKDLPGLWIPNINVIFSECRTNWPWVLEGNAMVDAGSLFNTGTPDHTIPEVRLDIDISAKAHAGLQWEDRNRKFSFNVNAQSGLTELFTR